MSKAIITRSTPQEHRPHCATDRSQLSSRKMRSQIECGGRSHENGTVLPDPQCCGISTLSPRFLYFSSHLVSAVDFGDPSLHQRPRSRATVRTRFRERHQIGTLPPKYLKAWGTQTRPVPGDGSLENSCPISLAPPLPLSTTSTSRKSLQCHKVDITE